MSHTKYLATPEDTDDFCNGIMKLLSDENLRNNMRQNCREIALEEYLLELQAKLYIDLYHRILND